MCAGPRSVVALLVSALILAACGGSSSAPAADPGDTAPGNGTTVTQGQTQSVPPDLQVPKSVPRRATGPARPSSTRVIRRWLAALDRGDVERAARSTSHCRARSRTPGRRCCTSTARRSASR